MYNKDGYVLDIQGMFDPSAIAAPKGVIVNLDSVGLSNREYLSVDRAIRRDWSGISPIHFEPCWSEGTVCRADHKCGPELLEQYLLLVIGKPILIAIDRCLG